MSETEQLLAELVPAASSGDARALQEVIGIIHPMILRYARARISGGRHPTAEDVTQEILLAVATSIGNFVDRGRPFMAFVYGIASNKVADAHRSYSRDLSNPTEEVPDEAVDRETPEEYALVTAGSNRVRELLDLLSEKPREILILRVFVGLSAEETAEIVGSTPGAVRVAQHRALATLRKAIEQEMD
ncbi:sigma-70 family RNA polymerase sigma factor [Corynebacterium felinum]|uniref:RNA polymerase sigma-70 factor (ECF subfamily) n=1 Tax=Corynebacterium felinum TaxID=131318 RepID=A0ABU2B816_9CORY|nr:MULTISPECIES: sigma-70 family RNA polymerase sigma factor [Corynebacterium]MDF5820507.1 sigma-70 family RNA polymerase sigma factor [Corynebacterium felinum]MDO4760851.1 sigma-70 family RNA polymerase sigma factor [Corynebacterium sp.]MDR7354753.1 RNA polymerase sigma-70 factor (ECF subfamily) [Corynebacterium felinum]WJY94116.1 ECF RNA polymerase sigma factor SigD [Corynebacterium felinum]